MDGVKIRGRLAPGLGEASWFTQLPWVVEQCREKLGFVPYPGTVNLQVLPQDQLLWDQLKARPGISIEPLEASFCDAACYPVSIRGQIKGAALVPRVPDYPASKIELLAPERVTNVLNLAIGDEVELTIS